MELFPLNSIALNAASEAQLAAVNEAARKVNEFRPMSPAVVKGVLDDLLSERVYSSNAIEGNTYDLRETRAILSTGHIEITKKREATEVLNLGRAIWHIESKLNDASGASNVEEFLAVHRILLRDLDENAGCFRNHAVTITGAKHQPPDHRYVRDLMDRCFEVLARETAGDPVARATWAHWAIARIHPFRDGNGRMARLWLDLLLLQSRLTCAIIRPEDRRQYLDALQQADDGDFNALLQLVTQRLLATFDKYLIAQQQADQVDQWASSLVGEVHERVAQERHLQYMRWKRKMESLRYAFERCAGAITGQSNDAEIQFHSHDLIDQPKWESIRAGVKESRVWLFRLVFKKDKRYRNYIFFFGKHYWSDVDTHAEKAEPRVCLLVSEQLSLETPAIRLGADPANPLTLREVFVVRDAFVRKRRDPGTDQEVYDRDIDPLKLAQEFIGEVLLLRMT